MKKVNEEVKEINKGENGNVEMDLMDLIVASRADTILSVLGMIRGGIADIIMEKIDGDFTRVNEIPEEVVNEIPEEVKKFTMEIEEIILGRLENMAFEVLEDVSDEGIVNLNMEGIKVNIPEESIVENDLDSTIFEKFEEAINSIVSEAFDEHEEI